MIIVTITIKNIPEQIYEQIKTRAKRNHRSINGEIISILEQATTFRSPVDVQSTLERARKVRELTANYTVTADEIKKMINVFVVTADEQLLKEFPDCAVSLDDFIK